MPNTHENHDQLDATPEVGVMGTFDRNKRVSKRNGKSKQELKMVTCVGIYGSRSVTMDRKVAIRCCDVATLRLRGVL